MRKILDKNRRIIGALYCAFKVKRTHKKKRGGREINYLHQSLSQLVSQEGELEIKISHMIGVNYKRLGKHGAKWMQARIYVECERMGGRRIAWGEYMWGANICRAKDEGGEYMGVR